MMGNFIILILILIQILWCTSTSSTNNTKLPHQSTQSSLSTDPNSSDPTSAASDPAVGKPPSTQHVEIQDMPHTQSSADDTKLERGSDVLFEDIQRCRGEREYLDSSIIDAYLGIIVSSSRGQTQHLQYIPNYIVDMYKAGYGEHADEIDIWIKKIHWAEIEHLFIPMFLAPNHWAMAVYDTKANVMQIFDSKIKLERAKERSVFVKAMKEFIMLIAIMHVQSFDEDAQIIERNDVPQQDNDWDCGVFALMFAFYIGQEGRIPETFEHYEMDSTLFREKIYQDLMHAKLKMARRRSIHNLPLIEKNDKEVDELKKLISEALFDNNELIQAGLKLHLGLFHYKRLTRSILWDFDKEKSVKESAEFRAQIDKRKREYLLIAVQPSVSHVQNACRFYKTLMRLKRDEILAQSVEWHAYFHFRMRHFYWIDDKWEENNAKILSKLVDDSNCETKEETTNFNEFYANEPQSYISNYWTLKWLLNNSPMFNAQIEQLNPENLLIFKERIYALTGASSFDRLEMAAPDVMQINATIDTVSLEYLKRILNDKSSNRERYEYRMALGHLLSHMTKFGNSLGDAQEIAKEEELAYYDENLIKFDKIRSHIVVELVQLVDEEITIEEENKVLNRMVCVALKFYEINVIGRLYSMISIETFAKISLNNFMDCTQKEMESSMERQRIVLGGINYSIIEKFLKVDIELQNILKKSSGSIYRLNQVVGSFEYLRQIWQANKASIRSENYFSDPAVDDHIREYYNKILQHENAKFQYISKINANIYAIMKWIESNVGKNKSFKYLIETWRCAYRNWLDQLHVQPDQARRVGMEVNIMSAKIVAFVKSKRKADNFIDEELDAEDEVHERINKNLPEPPLSEDVQNIHVANFCSLAQEDKGKKRKDGKKMNFWLFFQDLYKNQEKIAKIGQLLNIDSLRKIHDQLGLKFHEREFTTQFDDMTKEHGGKLSNSDKSDDEKESSQLISDQTNMNLPKDSQNKPEVSADPDSSTDTGRGQEIEKLRSISRRRSVHKLSDEGIVIGKILLKSAWSSQVIIGGIFAQNYNEREDRNTGINVVISLFHFKKLSSSMLFEYKKKYSANESEAFRKELEAAINELLELSKMKGETEEFACSSFKFFMQLVENEILGQSEEWNKYVRFRMRYFYWIDPKWPENSSNLMENFKISRSGCTHEELRQFPKKVANAQPYSRISHYWTLKWLMQNSAEFIESVKKQTKESLWLLKRRIFTLVGENGCERLELAIPALNIGEQIDEMIQMSLKRCLTKGIEATKFELRLALSKMLDDYLQFISNLSAGVGGRIESLQEYLNKMDKIYTQIVEHKLVQLVDEEHSVEEEIHVLTEAVCILLKFYVKEKNARKPSFKFSRISYEEAMKCSAEEMESTLSRERALLNEYYYEKILRHLPELEGVLKYGDGSNYLLKELIGSDRMIKLWNEYPNQVCDRQYFANKNGNLIRQLYEIFLINGNAEARQMSKPILNIYLLMRWLDATLKNNRNFNDLMETWHCLFRNFIDELRVHPNRANKLEIESTFIGEKIIEFVYKWRVARKQNAQIIYDDYYGAEAETKKLFFDMTNKMDKAPALSQHFQHIHMEAIKDLATRDKAGKKKQVDGGINFWQFFNDLSKHPEQIEKIGELLDINTLKELHKVLGMTFHDDYFKQLGEVSTVEEGKLSHLEAFDADADGKSQQSPNELHTIDIVDEQQTQRGTTKSAKKKQKKKNKAKTATTSVTTATATTSTEDEEKVTTESKETEALSRSGSERGSSTSASIPIPDKSPAEIKAELKRQRKNLKRFMKDYNKSIEDRRSRRRRESSLSLLAFRPSQSSEVISKFAIEESTKFNRRTVSSMPTIHPKTPSPQHALIFCRHNVHLNWTYENLLKNPTNLMREVLDACVYINEINGKLSLAEVIVQKGRKPLWKIDEPRKRELENRLQRIIDRDLITVKTITDVEKLKENLHALFVQVKMLLNGNNETLFGPTNIDEMADCLTQMHFIKLSYFISIKWPNKTEEFMNKSKVVVFGLLQQTEHPIVEGKEFRRNYKRFLDRIDAWKKHEAQRKLDDKLFLQDNLKNEDFLLIRKSHDWQQIILGNAENDKHFSLTKELQKQIEFVDPYIEVKKRDEYQRAQVYKKAIDEVENIVKKRNKMAKLLHTGSYLIGAMTVNSDVDTICMFPEGTTLDKFFGEAECKIIGPERTCGDKSMHCALCLAERVINLEKVPAKVPLLKFSYCLDEDMKALTKCEIKVDFDLLFAAVRKTSQGDYDIDGYANLLNDTNDKLSREQFITLTSLTGYKQNTVIRDVLPSNKRNFRITVGAIKHWAKKNHIYNAFHGYLKGIGITIMAAKIAIMFPNGTVPFLLQMFFFYFIEWPDEMPVQLMEVQKWAEDVDGRKPLWEKKERNNRSLWHGTRGLSTKLQIPIVTPWYEEDISFTSSNIVTENTKEIVMEAMQNALKNINQMEAPQSANWHLFLNGMNISAEYQHFIVINCGRSRHDLSDDPCSFANSKLSNQMIYQVVHSEENRSFIRRAHIMHVKGGSGNRCILPSTTWMQLASSGLPHGVSVSTRLESVVPSTEPPDYNTFYCKTWLVGIKFMDDGKKKYIYPKEQLEYGLARENRRIFENYSQKNKQKYEEMVKNQKNYFLQSKFVTLKELDNWGITLHASDIMHH